MIPMKRSMTLICAALFAILAGASLKAQMGPATPSPELKKLDFMAGDWTSEGDIKAGGGMPGGKFTVSSHAEWMEGNFFLVEHSDADMAGRGEVKGKRGGLFLSWCTSFFHSRYQTVWLK